MRCSEKIDQISKALLGAQKEIGAVSKSADNPFYKSKYADLSAVIEAIKEPLNKNGVCFLQLVNSSDGDTVETIFLHETGQYISSETAVYCKKPDDPQAFGSGVTYAKRYALQAALGLPTEDDDGNAASKKGSAATPEKPKPVELSDNQHEFVEKLKINLEETDEALKINKDKLVRYLTGVSQRQGKPIPDSDEMLRPLAGFITNKPELLNQIKE